MYAGTKYITCFSRQLYYNIYIFLFRISHDRRQKYDIDLMEVDTSCHKVRGIRIVSWYTWKSRTLFAHRDAKLYSKVYRKFD